MSRVQRDPAVGSFIAPVSARGDCGIQPGDTIAVWGCGPVGQFAIASAYLLGAERVIAIDRFPYRMQIARERAGAETINYEQVDVFEMLKEMTGGRGPDHCIDAVGLEGHAPGVMGAYDRVKTTLMLETDRDVQQQGGRLLEGRAQDGRIAAGPRARRYN